jgi:hypothetical protein
MWHPGIAADSQHCLLQRTAPGHLHKYYIIRGLINGMQNFALLLECAIYFESEDFLSLCQVCQQVRYESPSRP